MRVWALVAAADLRSHVGPIVRLALAFELLRFVILAPLGAGVLQVFLERWGRCSVGNFEILAFLLSPLGLAALLATGTIALTTVYLEVAGLALVLARRSSRVWTVFAIMGQRLFSLLELGARQFLVFLALAAPFLAAIAGVLGWLWAGDDLNGLVVLRPPVFWIGVALGGCLAAGYAAIAGYFLLRWLLALPAVLFEPDVGAAKAMRLSRQRTRGKLVAILRLVLAWLAAVVLSSTVLLGGLRLGSGWLLDHAGFSLPVVLPMTAVVLIVNTLAVTLLTIGGAASFASLLLVFYREFAGLSPPSPSTARSATRASAPVFGVGLAAAVIGIVGLACYGLVARVELNDRVEITAHRGGAAVAPENTVAAIRKAIEARADWAEIDVQRTADGAIVVLHDSDLTRVGGLRQRVSQSTLAEIKSVDVGRGFREEFRGERVPTLDEAIAAAGEKIRLNIELKPHGSDDVAPLVRAVLDSVKRAGITDRCRLCSQSYESLQLARRVEPRIHVGFIAGARVGDLTRLEVAFLMVAERLATRRLADAAGTRGIEVHAWTINDPDALFALVDRGVANIITDDPAALRRRLKEIQSLSLAERLLLRARNLLAG